MKANASILIYENGKLIEHGAYGVSIRSDGGVDWCSEHQAGIAPEGPMTWLQNRFSHLSFELRRDDGAAYYADLRRSLGLPEITDERPASLAEKSAASDD